MTERKRRSAEHYGAELALRGRSVRLISRRGTEWTADFPQVVKAARGIRCREALLDGEIVMLSVRGKLLERRKAALHDLIGDATGIIRYTEHFEGDGDEVLRHACSLGAEGIVSKRRDAPYHSGARNADWQKIKCIQRFVKPRLVAEVEFTEWTAGGNVRHPSLQGLRPDKKPREVVRERPARASDT